MERAAAAFGDPERYAIAEQNQLIAEECGQRF
jgi:hypothetical protein